MWVDLGGAHGEIITANVSYNGTSTFKEGMITGVTAIERRRVVGNAEVLFPCTLLNPKRVCRAVLFLASLAFATAAGNMIIKSSRLLWLW